jgi:hypothetical protein
VGQSRGSLKERMHRAILSNKGNREETLLRYLCYLLFNQSACEKIVLDGCFEQEGTE